MAPKGQAGARDLSCGERMVQWTRAIDTRRLCRLLVNDTGMHVYRMGAMNL